MTANTITPADNVEYESAGPETSLFTALALGFPGVLLLIFGLPMALALPFGVCKELAVRFGLYHGVARLDWIGYLLLAATTAFGSMFVYAAFLLLRAIFSKRRPG